MKKQNEPKPTNMRQYNRVTNRRLVVGAILLLFVVGDGLIYLIYGKEAGTLGLLCTAAGLAPIGLIAASFKLLELVRKRLDHD
jgi:hypothetical protein